MTHIHVRQSCVYIYISIWQTRCHHTRVHATGLGFRVQGLVLTVVVSQYSARVTGVSIKSLGFRVQGLVLTVGAAQYSARVTGVSTIQSSPLEHHHNRRGTHLLGFRCRV
jgi:hypothetical protein